MTAPMTDPGAETPGQKIRRQIAAIRTQGGDDADVAAFLSSHPGVKQVGAVAPAESTRVAPRPSSSSPSGATEGVADRLLNTATFGLHRKGLGVTDALLDVLSHGTSAHPIDTYTRSTSATDARMAAAKQAHPMASTAADATGTFAPIAFTGLLRAALALPEAGGAAVNAAQSGAKEIATRIGRSGLLNAAAGAGVTGIASSSPLKDIPREMVGGGLLGGLLGLGGSAAAEGAPAIRRGVQRTKQALQPAQARGERAALQHIADRFGSGGAAADELTSRAREATRRGGPATVAHLGGEALDPVTYFASTGADPESAALRTALDQAQRGEEGLLQRGVSTMSGLPDNPTLSTPVVTGRLTEARAAGARSGYPKAYAAPDLRDERILSTIRSDADLREALDEGYKIMQREQQVAALQGRLAGRTPPNPLTAPKPGAQPPVLSPIGKQLAELGVPMERLVQEGHAHIPPDAPAAALPIQLLDYMKRGADVVIERGLKKGNLSAHDAGLIQQKIESILNAVDDAVPDYGQVRGRYAAQSSQLEAAEHGTKALQRSGPEIATDLAGLPSDAARDAYRTTATSTLRDQLRDKRYGSDLSSQLFDNPGSEAQLQALYGAEGTNAFQPYREDAAALNRVRQAATGNSATAPRAQIREDMTRSAEDPLSTLLASRKRSVFDLPGRLADARREKTLAIMRQVLARQLRIPASSPEVEELAQKMVEAQLSQPQSGPTAALPQGRPSPGLQGIPQRLFPTGSPPQVSGGILAGLLSRSSRDQ